MAANIVSERRKNQARKHANRSYTCVCGKVCKGNGGRSSHRKACAAQRAVVTPNVGIELPAGCAPIQPEGVLLRLADTPMP